MCQLFAATYPERVSALILMSTYSNARLSIPSYRDVKALEEVILKTWGTGASLPDFAPEFVNDAQFVDWWAEFERLSASPSAVIRLRQMNAEIDVTAVLGSISSADSCHPRRSGCADRLCARAANGGSNSQCSYGRVS